ncbi:HAMP domain-containing histidine kinase [Bacteroidales bacterium OttesenSCG-928-K22]|nr:HAMP domain-containing histidine kinase [Bacteroidales bacterium OttesenSCG-928-L14]MDL2240611.1 HAMP domain-containing histidine kinase [Bacteroidales bacterium OttesenSCG-928-K22]
MNIYFSKAKWKWVLAIVIICIIAVTLWYNNMLVRKFILDEQKNLIIWADAIRHRAELVESTELFFDQLQHEERAKVETLAHATRLVAMTENSDDRAFYLNIISNNTTIPVIQTDKRYNIISGRNLDFDIDTVPTLSGNLRKEFSVYEPIEISSYGIVNYLFYKDSQHFTALREYLETLIHDFFAETVINSSTVPVIITDSTKTQIINMANIPPQYISDTTYLLKTIESMHTASSPIELSFAENKNYIFYSESEYISRLKTFPLVQFFILFLFFIITYFLYRTARRSEENRIWAGLAKETAHQLGTPLSSIMAWVELLKLNGEDEIAEEIGKDVARLGTITKRFSKIGSVPSSSSTNICIVVEDSINYLKKRTSDRISFVFNKPDEDIIIPLSEELFEWVIENICKNAVDAMGGKGTVTIDIFQEGKHCIIDISDTGKGIPRSKQKEIFNPGITSKERGWGLGLSLAKRIVENMHHGKIFVKSSAINKGTTFRIMLKTE